MKRGEVWLVNLDPTVGAEIKKTRPVVIVSHDALGLLPLEIIVPITTWQDKFARADWHVKISPRKSNGLAQLSSVDTFQVRSVSKSRLVKRLGELGADEMARVAQGLILALGIQV